MMKKRDPTGKSPVVAIGTDNIDSRLNAIEAAGEKIVLPKFAIGKYRYYT